MLPMWWISVADLSAPAEDQFLGVVITEAPNFHSAVHTSAMLGLGASSGGGHATGGRVPEQFESVYRPYADRVLDKEEAEFVASMKPLLS